jgi:hypothetical protein
MRNSFFLIISICSLIACRQADTEYSDEELVNPEEVMAYEEDDTLVLKKIPDALAQWLSYYHQIDTGFTLKNFKASGVSLHMDVLPDAINSGNESDFNDLYLNSPDSSRYLDLVSYNFILERTSGKNYLLPGDADQQVVLADRSKKIKKQLMYHGPSQLAEIAEWTGRESFLIGMISQEENMAGLKAEIYFFHLKDSTFTNFLLNHVVPDSLRTAKGSFLQQYFATRNYELK